MELSCHDNSEIVYDYFPGHNFSGDERNIAAIKYLDELFVYSRVDDSNSCQYFVFMLYIPIGILLLFVRVIVFFPLVGIACAIRCTPFCLPRSVHTLLMRFHFLVYFGVLVSAKGEPDKHARIWVSNHISEMDALAIRCLADPYILGYSFYKDLWWLALSPLGIMNMIYVPEKSRTDGNTKGRDSINEHINKVLQSDSKSAILLFPEGGLTNTGTALLQYHKYVFGLNHRIQPITLKILSPLPVHTDTGYASFVSNVLWFIFIPFQRYEVCFLPAQDIRESESSLDFSRRVMFQTARQLKTKVSPFLYADKRKWLTVKKKMADRGHHFAFDIDEDAGAATVRFVSTPIGASKLPNQTTSSKDIFPENCEPDGRFASHQSHGPVSVSPETDDTQKVTAKDLLLNYVHEAWGMKDKYFSHLIFVMPSVNSQTQA